MHMYCNKSLHAAKERFPQMSAEHFEAAPRRTIGRRSTLLIICLGKPGDEFEEPWQCLW